jgi:polar amino acid transport system substrate-binding protein
MKMLFRSLAVVALIALSGTAQADGDLPVLESGELQVATEGTFPPFSMRAPSGDLDGLEVRVMKEVAKRLDLEYTPVLIKWDSLLVGLQADQYDVISAAMDITPERQDRVTFSNGWLESGAKIVVQNDSDIQSQSDLKGKTVGTLVSSTFTKIAEDSGAKVKGYKAESDAMQDLVNGNVDAVITDAISAAYDIKMARMPLRVAGDYISHVQKGFAFKKGNVELANAVNQALASMMADGTYAKLTTDLIGFDPAPKEPIATIE